MKAKIRITLQFCCFVLLIITSCKKKVPDPPFIVEPVTVNVEIQDFSTPDDPCRLGGVHETGDVVQFEIEYLDPDEMAKGWQKWDGGGQTRTSSIQDNNRRYDILAPGNAQFRITATYYMACDNCCNNSIQSCFPNPKGRPVFEGSSDPTPPGAPSGVIRMNFVKCNCVC